MSFTKSHNAGFDTTLPAQESAYTYAQPPSFAPQDQVVPATEAPHVQNSQAHTFMGGSPYQGRPSYDSQQSTYIDMRPRPIPEIKSFSPNKGSEGTKIYVCIAAIYELAALSFPLMFGSRRCDTVLTKTGQRGRLHQYALAADVPSFSETDWPQPQVTVLMHMEDEDGQRLGVAEVGEFTYINGAVDTAYPGTTTTKNPRKRKISAEPLEDMRSPPKRQASQQLRPKSGDEYPQYAYQPGSQAPYSPYLQSPSNQSHYQYASGYDRPEPQNRYPQQSSPGQFTQAYQFPTTSGVPQSTIKAPSPAPWSPQTYQTVGSQASRSPGITASAHPARPAPQASSSPSTTANPPLIRTSTLQQSPSPASTPAGAAKVGQPFNPYAMYPHKAVLKINGDLDSLAEGWSLEEWEAKRRIVQFWRHQNGSAIHTHFSPVASNERPPNSICISCIWWEEKKECYVTSVDTIYLLESLVAVRFTVEEKNRIRRNLEGFRPLTVSKAKSDSEDFFKLIMSFPNPKPRNIEKDVKVFPWKILAHALKKIIGKYKQSASYSSTAGALLTPVSSSGYGNGTPGGANASEASSSNTERHITASPRSATGSATSSVYPVGITTTALSPNIKQQVGPQQRGGPPPELRVAVPAVGPPSTNNNNNTPNTWAQPHMHPAHSQDGNAGGRVAWDFTSFIDDASPASATPGGSQVIQYQRGIGIPDHRESNIVHAPKSHQISGA